MSPVTPERDRTETLLGTYLFQDLSPAELAPLPMMATRREYRPGDYADRVGAAATHLLVVESGFFKETIVRADGHEVITEFYGPGLDGVFGEPALFVAARCRMVNLIALTRAHVLLLERDVLVKFLLAHPPAMLRMLEGLATEARNSARTVASLAHQSLSDRVAIRLLELANRFGTQGEPATSTVIRFPITHALLAEHVGASRANVSRALAELANAGYLRVEGRTFVLVNPRALKALLP